MIQANAKTLVLISLMLAGCGGGGGGSDNPEPTPTPTPTPTAYTYEVPAETGDTWTVGSAADNGIDVSLLENMVNDIRAGQFNFVDSVVVVKDGVLVFDETTRTRTDDKDARVGNTNPAMHAVFSVSKSITSLVVGIAIDEGYIAGVDEPYLGLFPYPSYANPDARKDAMTLKDVLAMQTGLAWNESDPPYSSPDNQWNRFIADEFDYSKAVLDLPMVADPGTVFAYSTAATVSLGQAVENAVPMSLVDFGMNELILPLGIGNLEILTTPTGLPNGGSGFYLLTRDAAKFGQLLLNGGIWNGERIVSETWLEESLTPRTAVGWPNPDMMDWQVTGYGYQWWLGHYEFNGEQIDSYVAWGWGGQWIVALPALDLVVVIMGDAYDGEDSSLNQAHAVVRQYILNAVMN